MGAITIITGNKTAKRTLMKHSTPGPIHKPSFGQRSHLLLPARKIILILQSLQNRTHKEKKYIVLIKSLTLEDKKKIPLEITKSLVSDIV